MAVKLVVMYPCPQDVEAFEKDYNHHHVPMAVEKLASETKIVTSKIVGSPRGTLPFYRIAEIHFPPMAILEACTTSEGGKQTIANASSDFFRQRTNCPGRRRGSICVSGEQPRMTALVMLFQADQSGYAKEEVF